MERRKPYGRSPPEYSWIKGDHLVANCEAWQGKEETNTDGTNIEHLNAEHFIIHTLLHYSRHLSDEGFAEIKWLVDLLYPIKAWKIDWSNVRGTWRKWGIEKEILPVIATLNQYWQADVPYIDESNPIDLQVLVEGKQNREKEYYANLPASYIGRFLQVRRLPHAASKFRYIRHLIFPTEDNLRWRYNLSSKWFIAPYYFLHPFFTLRKFLTGLWYELVYRTD